jgi:hypothetical protein
MNASIVSISKKLSAGLAVSAITMAFSLQTYAGPFTYGNIVVLQQGDGVNTLSATSAPVALIEFTVGGSVVQTINIPTNGGSRLTQVGNSATEGFLSRSLNTSNLVFSGYDASAGGVLPVVSNSVSINRLVGQVDFNGNFTRTAISSSEYSGANNRSATSDGSNYWTSGSSGGCWYSANGATPTQIGGTSNMRVTKLFNGNLYYSTASGTIGLFVFTSAGQPTAPTSSPATTNNVFVDAGASPSPYDFAINAATNVIYLADDRSASTGGGVQKWTFSGGIWTSNYTFGAGAGLTAGCRALAVDFSGVNPIIYATTADSPTKLITITDNGASAQATTLATGSTSKAFRGVALAPGSASSGPPSISGITPFPGVTNSAGSTVVFNVTANGTPPLGYFWYKEIPGSSTNLIPAATTAALSFPSAAVADSANYQVVVSNSTTLTATSSVVTLLITNAPPVITGIGPTNNLIANAGTTVSFTVTNTGTPPFTFLWYKEIPGISTNLITFATTATLTLTNVLGGDTANYQVIITNATPYTATSSVVALTVVGDPHISTEPSSVWGLLDGTVSFTVGGVGTSPSYQWYYSDGSGHITGPVANGTSTPSGVAVVSGSATSALTIANLQASDTVNVVAVVTNVYGAVTSSVASVLAVSTSGSAVDEENNPSGSPLALWNFNGSAFTNWPVNVNCIANPTPYYGAGIAQAVGSCSNPPPVVNSSTISSTSFSPFSGSVDPNDGLGFGLPPPYTGPFFSWGTDNYPATGGNKQSGVQFNVSTVGAKNIQVYYDSRVSATASDYERLQYSTNGTDWVDYPASSTFAGIGTTFRPYSYDLTGFPGVANNPNFAIRIVTEIQSTASYGVSSNTNYVGTANTYGTAGTVTYDLVNVYGDATTNSANMPPVVSGLVNTNSVDTNSLTIHFTVSDDSTLPDNLTYNAAALNVVGAVGGNSVNPIFAFGGSGANRTLTISHLTINDTVDATPILVTATDANGDTGAAWFTLTVTSVNLPPTNSLTSLTGTNTLANNALTIPFTVGDDRTPTNGLLYSTGSGNNTVIPSGNIVVNGQGTGNPSVTITPANNQVGVGLVSVTVNDNDSTGHKTTTASIPFMVRPNTNVVAVDYFNYDSSGSLDTIAAGFWNHISGGFGQMQVGTDSGIPAAKVDASSGVTENLTVNLLGAPYTTNSGVTLYASFGVNLDPALDPLKMPKANGTYIAMFGAAVDANTTANVGCCLVVSTNNAAPGFYRLGIGNTQGLNGTNSTQFPMDLSPGTNYTVVMALSLTNGFSTLWINPSNQSSASVTDTTHTGAQRNILNFELRESGQPNGGVTYVSRFLAGTTFNSVMYPPVANPDAFGVAANSSGNVLSPLQNDSGSILSVISVSPTNGTASISNGTNVLFTPTPGFTGTATIGYTIQDNLSETSTSLITITVTNGTLIPTVSVAITNFSLAGSNVVISGTNAQSGATYYLLSTTNVALPFSQWSTVATNVIGTANNFTFIGTNAMVPGKANQFYFLSSTNFNP